MQKINGVFLEGYAYSTGYETTTVRKKVRSYVNNYNDQYLLLDESVHSKIFFFPKVFEHMVIDPKFNEYDNLLLIGKSLGGVNVYKFFKYLFENHYDHLASRRKIALVIVDSYGFDFRRGFFPIGKKKPQKIPKEWKQLPNLKIFNSYQRIMPFYGAKVEGVDEEYEFLEGNNKDFNRLPHMNFLDHDNWNVVLDDVFDWIEG